MKKRLLSLISILLATVLMMLSLASCSIQAEKETLPAGMKFDSPDKIPYNANNSESLPAKERMLMSSVSITAKPTADSTSGSRGSGVIYQIDTARGDAYIITNHHVVYCGTGDTEICGYITVNFYGLEHDNYAVRAHYVGGSAQYDIAVLKITGNDILRYSGAVEAAFADSEEVSVTDNAIVVGNSEGEGISVTKGCISVASEYLTMYGADSSMIVNYRVIRTDSAVNPGNSGGGLYNSDGRIIGIINARNPGSENMGYAIPSNVARAVADNIIYFCDGTSLRTVYKCTLGIEVDTSEVYSYYDSSKMAVVTTETVKVVAIDSDVFDVNRYVNVGDFVSSIKIDGKTKYITRKYQIVEAMLDVREGSTVTVSFMRPSGTFYEVGIYVTNKMIYAYE